MEEQVGQLWHRLVTRAARRDYPEATVRLADVQKATAMMFRALGGTRGLRVEAATETRHGARRKLLEHIAGTAQHVELAWRDKETLRLPARIATFSERDLNRQLYLWLAAQAAVGDDNAGDWLQRNAAATAMLLDRYPGLAGRYHTLVQAHLPQRPRPGSLRPDEAQREQAIRQALLEPRQTVCALPPGRRAPWPVPLWLHPAPPFLAPETVANIDKDDDETGQSSSRECETDQRRRAERVDTPEGRGGLLAFRLESLFTRAEYTAVDRGTEETEDADAKSAVEDMEVLSLARERGRTASRLRFDLDLPPARHDDIPLGEGIALPEWDYRRRVLQPDYCRLQPMLAQDAVTSPLPAHLARKARRLRAVFDLLKPRRVWQHDQPDGTDLDINAVISQRADRFRGMQSDQANLFRSFRNAERDLSCLLLADLSLSTDSWVSNEQRVIDVIRDSLLLFSEALAMTGDRFALYGFSSRRRSHVRFHTLKTFEEPYTDRSRGRIQAIRPGYYTRMGAALRYATALLQQQPTSDRLLLLLTDGKPNDLDRYEGRYGIEDTRMAVREAVKSGVRPFCVTVDAKARDYLPYLFGANAWMLVRHAGELPARLPLLYARLTG
jgi:nitric oxide reductase NorD protein